MAELQFSLTGRLNLASDPGCLDGVFFCNDAGGIDGDMTFDTTVEDAARPRGDVQEVGVEIVVGSSKILFNDLIGAWDFERSVDRGVQTWSFSCPVNTADGVFGSPFNTLGSPIGLRTVDIYGVYQTTTGVHRIQLIYGGIVKKSRRRLGLQGYVDEFSGECRGGRYSKSLVSQVLAPGHGLTRDKEVRKLFELAGETRFSMETEGVCQKELQASKVNPFSKGQEIEDTSGRRIWYSTDGYLKNPKIGPLSTAATWTFTEQDILSISEVEVDGPQDPLTDVTLTSSEQKTREPNDCGLTTPSPFPVITTDVFDPVTLAEKQNSDFSLSAQTVPSPTNTTRTRTEEFPYLTYRCGQLIHSLIQTVAWKNPASARYRWSTSNTRTAVAGVYLPAGAVAGVATGETDSAPAYLGPRENFIVTKEVETWYVWDAPGYITGPSDVSISPTTNPAISDALDYLSVGAVLGRHGGFSSDGQGWENPGPKDGFLLGSITETREYYITKAPLKTLTGSPPEETDYDDGTYTLGTGEGLAEIREVFRPVQMEIRTIKANDDGGITEDKTVRQKFVQRAGTKYWWAGGFIGRDASEVYDLSEVETHTYISPGEQSGTTEILTFKDANGQDIPGRQGQIIPRDGNAPAVDQLPKDENNPGLYVDTSESANKKEATRGDTQTIKAHVHSSSLEERYLPNPLTDTIPLAENNAELEYLCRLFIQESAAKTIQLVLPCNFALASVDGIHVKMRPGGLDADLAIRSHRWSGGVPGTLATSTIIANHYPEAI